MSLPTEDPGPHDAAAAAREAELRAERDDLRQRLEATEAVAEQLAEELGQARAKLAATDSTRSSARFDLFDEAPGDVDGASRAADGSDRLLLPIALAATSLVVFLVAVLSLANNGFLSLFSLGSLLASGLLARAAWATRVVPVEVWVEGGVVVVRRGDGTLNFDLTSDKLRCQVTGEPGDLNWRVRFYRRGLEPCDVDATMVDPDAFMKQLRHYRPGS